MTSSTLQIPSASNALEYDLRENHHLYQPNKVNAFTKQAPFARLPMGRTYERRKEEHPATRGPGRPPKEPPKQSARHTAPARLWAALDFIEMAKEY